MRIVSEQMKPCPCHGKIRAEWGDKPGDRFGVGTVVECDCGKQYVLRDDQRDGLHWLATTQDAPRPPATHLWAGQ